MKRRILRILAESKPPVQPVVLIFWRYNMNETYDRCDSCGNAFERGRLTEFDGHQLCLDCLIRTTVICSHCGTRIWRDENAGDDTTPLCQHCSDRWYLSCSVCGRMIPSWTFLKESPT